MKRVASGLAALVLSSLAGPAAVAAAPTRVAEIEDVTCDNGQTVDVAFVLGSSPHSVFFVLNGGKVLAMMSYVFTDDDTGEVLLAASHPMNSNQPTTTCTGFDPNFDPGRGIEANFTLEVVFVPVGS